MAEIESFVLNYDVAIFRNLEKNMHVGKPTSEASNQIETKTCCFLKSPHCLWDRNIIFHAPVQN